MTRQREALQHFYDNLLTETDDCKIWPYAVQGGEHPYGVVRLDGKVQRVHVLACEAFNGPRPPGAEAAHGPCHQPRCWNGRHLRWATSAENQADRDRDGTSQHGERNGNVKLSTADVDEIRRLWARGDMTQGIIARRFDISQSTVSLIVRAARRARG